MDFRLLGAPEVWLDDRQLTLTAGKPLALLAVGLLRANRVVSVSDLINAVWGNAPPPTALALLQTYVSNLRRVLRVNGQQVIVTRLPGYLFSVGSEDVDVARFESLAARGRAAAAVGRHDQAAETLRTALALWRGPALDGLESPVLRQAAHGLEELRLIVLEERIDADLRMNRIGPLAAELAALVAAYPLRETLRAQQMLALFRLGRQADALEAYSQARRMLRTELGVEPGPELRRIHQAILSADASLDLALPVAATIGLDAPDGQDAGSPVGDGTPCAHPSPQPPRQLPPQFGKLIGREKEMAELRRTLLSAEAADHAVCCVITGKAGSGKTALANAVGHTICEAFPDGQLHGVFRGGGTGAEETQEILGAFLRALGEPASRLPDSVEERSSLFRSRIAGRRILIMLDNAGSEAQVRPLLPAHAGSAAILSSRTALVGLESQNTLGLDVLDPDDALRLLGKLAGSGRTAAEPAAAEEIVRLCGGLPLAVRTAGARLAARQSWPLSVLASRLRDERRRLDELVAGDLEVRATLQLSYSGLPDPIRLAFRRLGLISPAQFSPWLLAPLLDVTLVKAEYFAERLTDAQLADAADIGLDGQVRYAVHDLIRLFARERADAEEPPPDQRRAIERLGRLLLAHVTELRTGVRSVARAGPALTDDQRACTVPAAEPPDDAHSWLDQEQWTLVHAVERAAQFGLTYLAREMCEALLPWFRLRNSFDLWLHTHSAALAAAEGAGDRLSEAILLRGLGQLHYEQDLLDDAAGYYRRALVVFRARNDRRGEAGCLIGQASVHREQGRFRQALELLEPARAIYSRLDDMAGLAECGYGFGHVSREIGNFAEAEAALEEALAAYRQVDDCRGEGMALRSLAMVHRASGALDTAERLSEQAISVLTEIGDRLLVAYATQCLGKVRIRQGHVEHAAALLAQAHEVCTDFGDGFGVALSTRTIGELHLAKGELDLAVAHLSGARERWVALRLDLFRARTDRDLAQAHRRRGDLAAARKLESSALATFQRYGSRERLEPPAAEG
ncbi:BTAD domain-containing putative transcriptional regulator [Nonomuraea sp. NPDC050404]|uniref:AfsR/SARP family transcriptional regulator n=1 Tax=Nonomuraea sp. NPDC050404 TaxID=3155783 RepID=UPI0033FD5A63